MDFFYLTLFFYVYVFYVEEKNDERKIGRKEDKKIGRKEDRKEGREGERKERRKFFVSPR